MRLLLLTVLFLPFQRAIISEDEVSVKEAIKSRKERILGWNHGEGGPRKSGMLLSYSYESKSWINGSELDSELYLADETVKMHGRHIRNNS